MPSCLETFCESGFQGKNLQELVDELHPNFCCEASHCSPFSPGPVENSETLIFVIINPTHYDELRQQVVPLAFQEVHNRDLSVLRTQHTTGSDLRATVDELVERGMDRVPPQLRLVEFGCRATAAEVRQVSDERGRLFAVYDTALENKRGHASIFTRNDILLEKKRRAKARFELHRVFTATIDSMEDVTRTLA